MEIGSIQSNDGQVWGRKNGWTDKTKKDCSEITLCTIVYICTYYYTVVSVDSEWLFKGDGFSLCLLLFGNLLGESADIRKVSFDIECMSLEMCRSDCDCELEAEKCLAVLLVLSPPVLLRKRSEDSDTCGFDSRGDMVTLEVRLGVRG